MDREKVIAGLTMLVDRKNDDTCEGLKCCKIAEDALAMLKAQGTVPGCLGLHGVFICLTHLSKKEDEIMGLLEQIDMQIDEMKIRWHKDL